jgi:hypothetical protein
MKGDISMSREEAAWAYLDGLLGFRGDFGLFQRATDVLSEQDRTNIETAVSVRLPGGASES